MRLQPPIPKKGLAVTRRALWRYIQSLASGLGLDVECEGIQQARDVGGMGRLLTWFPKGRKGRKGAAGDDGPLGFPGVDAEPSTLPGDPGEKGPKGPPGGRPKGPRGPMGAVGLPGQNPVKGPDGPDGFPGADGADVPGIPGPPGPHFPATFTDIGKAPPGPNGDPGPPGAPSPADKTALVRTRKNGIISFSAREGEQALFRDVLRIQLTPQWRDIPVPETFRAVCEPGSLFVQHLVPEAAVEALARRQGSRLQARVTGRQTVRCTLTLAGVRRGLAHWRMPEFSATAAAHNAAFYARAHQTTQT